MWRLAAPLVAALAGYPLWISPSKFVAIMAGIAVGLSVLGMVVRSTPILTTALAVALGEYTLALAVSDSPSRLFAAVGVGVVVALALEIGDFDGRFRSVALGPRVVASQVWYWTSLGALGAVAALLLLEMAGAISAAVRLPWSPVLAAIGAFAALVAAAVALRRAGLPGT
jgi:hypothetical protein